MGRKFPTMSLNRETYEKIQEVAKKERRTLSGEILFLIENYYRNNPDRKKEAQ